jgi:hypothetical protein
MESQYEAPILVLVGRVDEVVLGVPGCGDDGCHGYSGSDFEYEPD